MVVRKVLFGLCLVAGCTTRLSAADWLQFRGNRVNGLATDQSSPVSLKKIAW